MAALQKRYNGYFAFRTSGFFIFKTILNKPTTSFPVNRFLQKPFIAIHLPGFLRGFAWPGPF
jgi:hypothetical protein